jgi:hypothetical protein
LVKIIQKMEHLSTLTILKAKRNYLIGTNMVLETDFLSLLCMIVNCSISDITMLRWIAYNKSLNYVLVHITSKKNSVTDMLSRSKYVYEEEMET